MRREICQEGPNARHGGAVEIGALVWEEPLRLYYGTATAAGSLYLGPVTDLQRESDGGITAEISVSDELRSLWELDKQFANLVFASQVYELKYRRVRDEIWHVTHGVIKTVHAIPSGANPFVDLKKLSIAKEVDE